MAFLSWLQSLGFALHRIALTMVSLGTNGALAQPYSKLTGDTVANAWPKFLVAVKAFPGISSDDPFGDSTRTLRGGASARSKSKHPRQKRKGKQAARAPSRRLR